MSTSKKSSFRVAIAGAVLLGAVEVKAQVCEPTADGFGCVFVACSPIPEDKCIATVVHLDFSGGGGNTVVACECMDLNDCHMEFGMFSFGLPCAAGVCPAGQSCEVFGTDTDGDGIEDQFTAECVSSSSGACCFDIDDGPIAYDTCMAVNQSTCVADGGVFHGVNTACCTEIQACCLFPGENLFCVEMSPFCCMDSGGDPKGAGSTCADIANQGGCGPCFFDFECRNADVCTVDTCVSGSCVHTAHPSGDVDHDGDVDLFDLFCILSRLAGDNSVCPFSDVDIEPCEGDGDIDLFDLFAVLNAFSGIDPCCGG